MHPLSEIEDSFLNKVERFRLEKKLNQKLEEKEKPKKRKKLRLKRKENIKA